LRWLSLVDKLNVKLNAQVSFKLIYHLKLNKTVMLYTPLSYFIQGDSGGPLRIGNRLIGVVSRNLGDEVCGQPNVPALYARVTSYLDWIKQNTASLSQVETNEVERVASTKLSKPVGWWGNTGIRQHLPYAGYSPITHGYNNLPFYWRGSYQPVSPSNLAPYYYLG